MTSRDFCYWLQGFFELGTIPGNTPALSATQIAAIQRHLELVFKHEIDPSMGDAKHYAKLDAIHKPPAIGGVGPDGTVYRC